MFLRIRWTNFLLLVVIVGAILLILPSITFAQEKSLVWERFDVDIVVNVDGTFDVCEHQDILFTDGEFTFGYRHIPLRNYGYLSDWSVTDASGNVYQEDSSENAFTFNVESASNGYTLRWYFPSRGSSSETYSVCYTVHDGLRMYDGGDQVWWKAIYGDRSFPVQAGRVRVLPPPPAQVQEYAAYVNSADASSRATATLVGEAKEGVIFELGDQLDAGEEFEVRVQFDADVVDGQVQSWQAQADAETAQADATAALIARWSPIATLGFCALGILLMFAAPAGLYLLWYKKGRSTPVAMVADYLPEPPDELPPGLAGTLLDETVDMQDILATIVDLARRKAISITEDSTDKGWFSETDFIYRREFDDVPLAPYEAELIKQIFGSRDQVRLSDLKNKFYKKLPIVRDAMYKAAVERGLFPQNPAVIRNFYYSAGCIGIVLAVLVGIGLTLMLAWLTPAAIFPGIGLGIFAIGLVILARAMPRKTDAGSEAAARWKAFKNYLKNIERYSNLEQQKEIWDRWLPYAIAFKVDKDYMRKFAAVNAPAPGWYFPSPTLYGPYRPWYYGGSAPGAPGGDIGSPLGGGGQGGSPGGGLSDMSRGMGTSMSAMSAGLGTMLSSAGSTFTSQPSSSGSSGGGWGGGGFSGGGGGGGGGGGFG